MITIVATQDIDRDVVQHLSHRLRTELETEVGEQRIGMLSADPPSWITLLADVDWWIKGLGIYAALYIAELVKEAGKSTWKNLAGKAKPAQDTRLEKMAQELATVKAKGNESTKVRIGIPFPNEYFTTSLVLESVNPEEIAVEVGLFLHYLPKIQKLIDEESLTENNVATGLFLSLTVEGYLEVWWFDSDSFQKESRRFEL